MQDADLLRRCHARARTWPRVAAVAAFLGLGGACASSNSDAGTGGWTGSGGAPATGSGGIPATGSGGIPATGTGGTTATAGSGGASGAGGSAGSGGASGSCAPRATFTEASLTILQAKWDAGTATNSGTGMVYAWAKTAWTANGNMLVGTVKACGSVLPPAGLTQLVGGGMFMMEFPDAAWDAPGMPSFPMTQTQSGWDVGSTINNSYAVMIGYTMANGATTAWPASQTGITMAEDPDGDMKPGLTVTSHTGNGYVFPPTSVIDALLPSGARADKVNLVFRLVASDMLTRTSCDEASGTTTVTHFDNHVVGCHISGGSDCTSAQFDFVDVNRTVFQVMSATMKTKIVPDAATCADVRTALRM